MERYLLFLFMPHDLRRAGWALTGVTMLVLAALVTRMSALREDLAGVV